MAHKSVEKALEKARWQAALFAEIPSRYELSGLIADWPTSKISLFVHRNQPFEFIAHQIPVYAAFADLQVEFEFSDYDSTLNFECVNKNNDIEIIWLDFDQYDKNMAPEVLFQWFCGRLNTLRKNSAGKILVSNWPGLHEQATTFNQLLNEHVTGMTDTFICDQAALQKDLGKNYFDERNMAIAGIGLSNQACLETARRFGLTWIPSVVAPRLKAIIVDLDHTLYSGVIEEDGIEEIKLESHHLALQKRLMELHDSGMMLAICSKNNRDMVYKLFRKRKDFPLTTDKFSAIVASWSSKSEGIQHIVDALGVSADSILFIDDNPAELADVASRFPDIKLLQALEGSSTTCNALRHYPGLHRWHTQKEDRVRTKDVQANRERAWIQKNSQSEEDYLKALEMKLMFYVNPDHLLSRLSQLSNKTNRFNTAFLRLDESEIARRLHHPEHYIIAVELEDYLSDSGVIGALFAHTESNTLIIDEICISCRALGRCIEKTILLESIEKLLSLSLMQKAIIHFNEGPKNSTAKQCLDNTLQLAPGGSKCSAIYVYDNNQPAANRNDHKLIDIIWDARQS